VCQIEHPAWLHRSHAQKTSLVVIFFAVDTHLVLRSFYVWLTTYRRSWRSFIKHSAIPLCHTQTQALHALWEPNTHPHIKTQAIQGKIFVFNRAHKLVTTLAVLERCSGSAEICFSAARQFVRAENEDRLRMLEYIFYFSIILRGLIAWVGMGSSCSESYLVGTGRDCHLRAVLKLVHTRLFSQLLIQLASLSVYRYFWRGHSQLKTSF
jgi:hypothetical protein